MDLSYDYAFTRSGTVRSNTVKLPESPKLIEEEVEELLVEETEAREEQEELLVKQEPLVEQVESAKILDEEIEPKLEEQKLAPIQVEVAQAFRAKDKLTVKVLLESRTYINPTDIIVILSGLEEGSVVEEQFQQVSDVVSGALKPEQRVSLLFSLNANRLTEYQVQCSWGEDARKVLAQKMKKARETMRSSLRKTKPLVQAKKPLKPKPETPVAEQKTEMAKKPTPVLEKNTYEGGSLVLDNIVVEREEAACDTSPCDILYTLTAQLVNSSEASISSIELALGLNWVSENQQAKVPEKLSPLTKGEERIALSDVTLVPQQTKKVRVSVDRAVPVVEGGEFLPHLRLLNFEIKQ